MKALGIARKTLLELWREPLILGLLLFFPAAFVGLYYVAFGRTEEGLATHLSILIINDDAGAVVDPDALLGEFADRKERTMNKMIALACVTSLALLVPSPAESVMFRFSQRAVMAEGNGASDTTTE